MPFDMHDIAFLQRHARSEAERSRTEKVNMHIARAPMRVIFKVVVLDIWERVAHMRFAGINRARPQRLAGPIHTNFARNAEKIDARYQLGADGTWPQLRRRQVEIVALFHTMIGKLVRGAESGTPGIPVTIDQVSSRDLRFFAPVLSIRRDGQRITMGAQDRPRSF